MTEVVLSNLTKEYLHNLGITIVCTLGQYSSPFNNQHQTAPPFSPIPPHQHPPPPGRQFVVKPSTAKLPQLTTDTARP